MMKIEMKDEWVLCPVCKSKTRVKARKDTVLLNFPLFCPKCKREVLIDTTQREVEAGFMPKINPLSVNISDYDVIAIGTPTWWYTMAPAVLTFLTTNDFSGKTIIPFMTNGGWPGHVIKDMKAKCKDADFMHEMEIQFDSMGKDHLETSEADITEWIEQIKTDINK